MAGSFGGNFRPIEDDKILSSGSLILLDVNHRFGGFGPANNSVPIYSGSVAVPNIAYKKFATSLGLSGGQATPEALACGVPSVLSPTEAAWQRTARGGVHGAISRTALAGGHTAYIEPPTIFKTYLWTRPTNRYYFAIEGLLTRKAAAASNGANPPLAGMFNIAAMPPANYFNSRPSARIRWH